MRPFHAAVVKHLYGRTFPPAECAVGEAGSGTVPEENGAAPHGEPAGNH